MKYYVNMNMDDMAAALAQAERMGGEVGNGSVLVPLEEKEPLSDGGQDYLKPFTATT